MAGDDLCAEGCHAALDPNLADAEITDFAGILLGICGAVAVVEKRIGVGRGEARAVPVAALRVHYLCRIPLAVQLNGCAGGICIIRVAADSRPVVGILVMDLDRAGIQRRINVPDVNIAREGTRGVGGNLSCIKLIARDRDRRGAVGRADLATGLFRLRKLLAVRVNVGDVYVAGACA